MLTGKNLARCSAILLVISITILSYSAVGQDVGSLQSTPEFSFQFENGGKISAGSSADITLTIENHYYSTIEDVILTAEICYPIDGNPAPPTIDGSLSHEFQIRNITDISEPIVIPIVTHRDTPVDDYLIRFKMDFSYNNTEYSCISLHFIPDGQSIIDYTNYLITETGFEVVEASPMIYILPLSIIVVIVVAIAIIVYKKKRNN